MIPFCKNEILKHAFSLYFRKKSKQKRITCILWGNQYRQWKGTIRAMNGTMQANCEQYFSYSILLPLNPQFTIFLEADAYWMYEICSMETTKLFIINVTSIKSNINNSFGEKSILNEWNMLNENKQHTFNFQCYFHYIHYAQFYESRYISNVWNLLSRKITKVLKFCVTSIKSCLHKRFELDT